jgi:hypothetical protein
MLGDMGLGCEMAKNSTHEDFEGGWEVEALLVTECVLNS